MSEITPLSAELRIITAGRTGFENDLRRDETIELIRARTAIDAIGELANPIDEMSPSGTVVLVGPDALLPGEEQEYIRAVRKVMPEARVVHISDSSADGAGFDATLKPGASTDRLWGVLGISVSENDPEPIEATPAPTPMAPSIAPKPVEPSDSIGLASDRATEPIPEPVEVHTRPIRPVSTGSSDRTDDVQSDSPHRAGRAFDPVDTLDEALLTVIRDEADAQSADPASSALEAALSGDDTLKAGLAELRAELGTETVRFSPGQTAEAGEPVQRGGRVFGALRADGVGRDALTRSAKWLASRLAIDEQLRALREAAFTDELTGAWNRRFFRRFLDRSIERARAERQDLSLMVFDIDDFKTYNDRYGHGAGDEILIEVVRLLTAVIRPHDRVCRIGGDEFAVIFADGPREASSRHPASIETLARRFQRQICEHHFPKLGSDAMGTLTISGGLATFPWEAYDSTTLIELADQLAMQSKRAGKNVITMGPEADQACAGLETDDKPGGQP